MAMSLVGVMMGVAFFVVTQAQTGGFRGFFVDTILGTDGAIRVGDRFQDNLGTMASFSEEGNSVSVRQRSGVLHEEGVAFPDELRIAIAVFPEVTGLSEILERRVEARSGFRAFAGRVWGVDPQAHRTVSDFERQVLEGSFDAFVADGRSILVGEELAARLRVVLGDTIQLIHGARNEAFVIRGIFRSGVSAIDRERIYMQLPEARSLLGLPFGHSYLQLSVADPDLAEDLAIQLEHATQHSAASWQERERVWLDVFQALRISAGISTGAIIFLAGLGIYNALSMQVVEKQREIAILRAVGYGRSDIRQIFVFQGGITAVLGIVLGWALGFVSTVLVSSIPLEIRGIFSTDRFVVQWSLDHYLWAAGIALVVAYLGSGLPAWRASQIEPGEVIRGM